MNLHSLQTKIRAKLLRRATGDMQQRARWYVRTRWYFLAAIGFPGIFSNMIGEGVSTQVKRDSVLLCIALVSNLAIFWICQGRKNDTFYRRLIYALLALDLLIITFLIFTKGGVESRAIILYTIPMLMSSAIFGSKGVYGVAWASIALYDSLIFLDWHGSINSIGRINPELATNTTYMINTLAFFSSVLLIIATLVDFIIRLMEVKEVEARESLQALESAQRIAKIGSWTWDTAKDSFVWSKQLHAIMGIDSRQFAGTLDGYLSFVHKDDRKYVAKTISDSVNTLEPFQFEHRMRINNEIRWTYAEGSVTSLKGALRAYGTLQDISERKQAELVAERRNRELQKLNAVMVDRELRMIALKKQIALSKNEDN